VLKRFASPVWAMMEYGAYPLLLFTATPWFLHRLGAERYGHWMLLNAAVGFGGALNTGTGAATIKSVSAAIGRAADKHAERTVRSALAIALLGGCALALAVVIVFWFADTTWLRKMGDPALVRLTGAAAALLIGIEQIDSVFSSAMKGAEHFGSAAKVEIGSKAFQIASASLVLFVSPTLSSLYITLAVVALLRLAAKQALATRLLHLVSLRPTFAGAREILDFAKWGWLQGIGGVLFGVADRMVVGSLLGATSLAYYSIGLQLAMQIHSASAAGVSVIFPKVSRKLESGEHFSLWRVTSRTMAANFAMSSSIALALILFGPRLLHAWVGPVAAGPTSKILPWLVIAYWALSLNVVPYYVLLGMGRMKFIGVTVVVAGIIAAVSMYFSVKAIGLQGASLGRGVYAAVSLMLLLPLAKHFLEERKGRTYRSPLTVAAVTAGGPLE
jgi:O-antigen/teichoic acid export membrane protein